MPIDSDQVSLREITAETVRAVTRLSVADSQQGFVAPNAVSLAQALFSSQAWYRAAYLGDELVGFVMLADESLGPAPPQKPGAAGFMPASIMNSPTETVRLLAAI